MNLQELIFGTADGGAYKLNPDPDRLTVVDCQGLGAELLAQATRDVLCTPARRRGTDALPFVRVRAARDDIEITVADDANAGARVLEESIGGRIPLFIEASRDRPEDDSRRELIVEKIARAAGFEDPHGLAPALAATGRPADDSGATEAETAFFKATSRAQALARQVREIDDQMTESVVPGWLFVATGAGGFGVLMTAVTLFNPDLRLYVIPTMVALFLFGLTAYAWRSWRELQIRGALQDQRAELRAEREAARASATQLAKSLTEAGGDPEEVLGRLGGVSQTNAPLIVSLADASNLGPLASSGRQTIVFVDDPAGASPEVVRALEALT